MQKSPWFLNQSEQTLCHYSNKYQTILSSNTNYMEHVWSSGAVAVEFRDVPQHVTLYTLKNTFFAWYTEVYYQLKQSQITRKK